jgi:ZIP family zinc transporter
MLPQWFTELAPVWQALIATVFTWSMTALGASTVFIFKNISRKWMDFLLGFTGGVMIAAAFWSLLTPSIELSKPIWGQGFAWVPPAIGFLLGAGFIYGVDKLIPHFHQNQQIPEGMKTGWNKTVLLVLAITIHNIPEGLAIGISFGAVALGLDNFEMGAAVALSMGIALQNLPEGMAVAMPMRRMGLSPRKSFYWGQMSAVVEPFAGVAGALAVYWLQPILPYALSFAAGAMIFVVIEDVVPEAQQDKYADLATIGFVIGFITMMALDVGLQ